MDLAREFASRPDYHQLPSYARVMESIHWDVTPLSGAYVFSKRLGPISFAKLQRPANIDIPELLKLQKRLHAVQLFIEPGLHSSVNGTVVSDQERIELLQAVGFKKTNDHHAYTKTLVCSIAGKERDVLLSFSQTARYHIRKSATMGVEYRTIPFSELTNEVKGDIVRLHKDWSKEKKVMGYTDSFLYAMWEEMTHEGTMVLAYKEQVMVGAMFVYTHHRVGMYFYQFSSYEARRHLHVPSGLAFHGIQIARARGCDLFDLCSAYDERYGKEHIQWKGFSEHKEQYHPTPIYYPDAFVRQLSFGF